MRVYYFLGYLLGPFALAGLHAYSHVTGAKRARVIVRNENEELLLLKTWLGMGKWGLPGGGIEKNEAPEAAALRELKEETGLDASSESLRHVTTIRSAGHDEEIFALSLAKTDMPPVLPNRFEIIEARWFSLEDLPPLEPLASQIMNEVVKKA